MTDLIKEIQERTKKTAHALDQELRRLRTDRAHPGFLEHVHVPYHEKEVPLNQVAHVAIENARLLTVTPWEKHMVPVIEKAITAAGLGLNPQSAGMIIRVPLPALTEERRKELVKLLHEIGEQAIVAVRNIRRDAHRSLKDPIQSMGEDAERRLQQEIEKCIQHTTDHIHQMIQKKEREIIEV